MIGCPRSDPVKHPAEGWCPSCPRIVLHRKIKWYEKARGYVYPGGHIQSTECRIYLEGHPVYVSDGGAAFIIDGCAHISVVGAL
jgi:hypothetical protein